MPSFTVGADLGQAQDYSAFAVLERDDAPRPVYRCRHLERVPLGTPYVSGRHEPPEARGVGERLLALLLQPPLPGCTVAVDETGVGRAVIDALRLLRLPCRLRPVTITAGASWGGDRDGSLRVPKRELVGTLQALLGQGRLHIAASLPLAAVLVKELNEFRVRLTAAAHETFGAEWRTGAHDDCVLALGIALWVAERFAPLTPGSMLSSAGKRPSPFARKPGPSPFARPAAAPDEGRGKRGLRP